MSQASGFALMAWVAFVGIALATPSYGQVATDAHIILAANGCGRGFFRTIDGECLPNQKVYVGPRRGTTMGPPCPRGFLRDPDPARPLCYPVY